MSPFVEFVYEIEILILDLDRVPVQRSGSAAHRRGRQTQSGTEQKNRNSIQYANAWVITLLFFHVDQLISSTRHFQQRFFHQPWFANFRDDRAIEFSVRVVI